MLHISDEAHRPFDLEHGPVFRPKLWARFDIDAIPYPPGFARSPANRGGRRIEFVRSHFSRFSGRRSPAGGWQGQPKDRVFRATFEAVHAYVRGVQRYTGRIVLFLGSSAPARAIYWRQLDWAHLAADGLEVRIGIDDCTDHAMMLRDPAHVRVLAISSGHTSPASHLSSRDHVLPPQLPDQGH